MIRKVTYTVYCDTADAEGVVAELNDHFEGSGYGLLRPGQPTVDVVDETDPHYAEAHETLFHAEAPHA